MKTKITKIFITTDARGKKEIRCDWDNDRHQAVIIPEDSARGVVQALEELRILLWREMKEGNLES